MGVLQPLSLVKLEDRSICVAVHISEEYLVVKTSINEDSLHGIIFDSHVLRVCYMLLVLCVTFGVLSDK